MQSQVGTSVKCKKLETRRQAHPALNGCGYTVSSYRHWKQTCWTGGPLRLLPFPALIGWDSLPRVNQPVSCRASSSSLFSFFFCCCCFFFWKRKWHHELRVQPRFKWKQMGSKTSSSQMRVDSWAAVAKKEPWRQENSKKQQSSFFWTGCIKEKCLLSRETQRETLHVQVGLQCSSPTLWWAVSLCWQCTLHLTPTEGSFTMTSGDVYFHRSTG